MSTATSNCTHITAACPLEATTYGYYPNLAGNVILCAVFGLCMLLQAGLSIKGRTWTWMAGTVGGCGLEFAGYIGRLLMRSNPWQQSAIRLQIITLILGPSFIAGSIDLTLKHLVIHFGPQYSVIRPTFYTWLFIGLDVFAILLQAAGGGLAAAGDQGEEQNLLTTGNNVILAGIALQVAQLIAFGIVSVLFAARVFHAGRGGQQTSKPTPLKLRVFICSVALAYTCILIRCIYRIPEMAGGWGSALQREEPLFLGLDGAVVAIAAVTLTVTHPTVFFPVMGSGKHVTSSGPEKELRESPVP